MVAIVTGKGAGLANSSAAALGANGQLGSASLGRSEEAVTVNAATGNLVINDIDEMLVGRGPDAVVARAYNSLGAWDGDNDDYWRAGVYRRVYNQTGTYGANGSTIARTDWDGSESVYTWNTTDSAYVATDGAGSYDTLIKSGSVWTWTDGDSRITEAYDASNSGRITSRSDTDGNSVSYTYTSGLITRITTSGGEYTDLTYSGTQLTALVTTSTSAITRTYYEYDGSDRLVKVLVNLSPADNSKTTGTNYETNYTYDSTSQRVASIAQSDGTLLAITYALVGSDYRVSTLTQTVATGVTRVTSFAYDTTNRITSVTDAAGQVTKLAYDTNGNLLSLTMPPSGTQDPAPVLTYTYESGGDIATIASAGNTVTYSYDSHGNCTLERDTLGNSVMRTFSAKNEMLTETRYTVPDPDGAGSGQPSGAMTTRYAYSSLSRLRFVVDAEGGVTEFSYDSYGQQTVQMVYAGHTYSLAGLAVTDPIAESTLSSWVSGLSDKSTAQRTETSYDFRGNISEVKRVAALLSGGAFDTTAGLSQDRTLYVYSAHGELLSRQFIGNYVPVSGTVTSSVESYVYDGLSRITSSTGLLGATTSVAFNDSSQTTTVTLANGLVRTSTYNKAGDLLTYAESGSGIATATSTYIYDALGRLRVVTDPTGLSRHVFYDADGRKTADVDGDGSVAEYRYDAAGRVTSMTAYATRLTTTQLASIVSSGAITDVTFPSLRPAATADDRWSWSFFDTSGRVIRTIDGTGAVTTYAYDGASQLVSATGMANRMSAGDITSFKASTAPANVYTSPNTTGQWSTSNTGVSLSGTLGGFPATTVTASATGVASATASQVTAVVSGTVITTTILLQAGSITIATFGLLGSVSGSTSSNTSAAIVSGPGTLTQVSGTSLFQVTGLSSAQPTLVSVTRTYGQTENAQSVVYVGASSGATSGNTIKLANPVMYAPVTASLPTLPSADSTNDRVSRMFYDNAGQMIGALDAEGYLTEFVYDDAGNKIRSIAYSCATSTTYRTSGTFAQLFGSITVDNAKDVRNWWLYNARGQMSVSLDSEGNLTRLDRAITGEVTRYIIGGRVDVTTLIATPPVLATVNGNSSSVIRATSVWERNFVGQMTVQNLPTNGGVLPVTNFAYDNMGRLVSTVTQPSSADPRTHSQRYDLRGRLTSELAGDGNVALAALGGSPTSTQIDTIYTDYGWTYAYDTADRLISKTGPRGSASAGPRTLYYYDADGRQAYEVDANGGVVEYRYDAFGERSDVVIYAARIASGTLASMTGGLASSVASTVAALADSAADSATHADFNVDGTLKQSSDALANVSTFAYNAFGELVTDVVPRDGSATIQTSRTYDRRGLLKTEVVDSASGGKAITTSYGYDAFGRAVTLTNALSKTTTSAYDRNGQMISTTDALGNTTTYTYNSHNNLVAITDALGKVTRFVYDKAGRKIATIDALGTLTTSTYDLDGRLIAERAYLNTISLTGLALGVLETNTTLTAAIANTNAADHVTRYAYDKDGQLRFTLDGLGHVTENVNDVNGNVVRTIAYDGTITATPSGGVYSTAWFEGQVSSLTSSNNRITRAVYDATNRLTYSIDAIGQVVWTVYDAKGQVAKQVEFAALYTTTGDPLVGAMDTWRGTSPVTALAGSDRTTRAYYDKKGQLTYSVDALGYVTQVEYDKLGNVRKQTAFANATTLTLSETTALTAIASNLGTPGTQRITEFTYDSAGRLETTIDPEGFVTKLVRDAMGQITSSTAAFGTTSPDQTSVSTWAYDDIGRVTTETHAYGATEVTATAYVYDALGQTTQRTIADGTSDAAIDKWEYDALGQVTKMTRGYGTSEVADSLTSYDVFGRVVTATDPRGSVVANSYDVIDQLLTQTQQLESGTTDDRVTSYTYDAFGSAVKVNDPRGNDSFAYYDKLGRVFRQVDAEKLVTDTAYTRGSQAATVKRYWTAASGTISETSMPSTPSGTVATTTFAYDKRDALTSATDAVGGVESYTINAFGERATVTNKLGGITTNVYDKRGLLLSETSTNAAATVTYFVNTFAYDARSNRTQMVEAYGTAEARTTTYTHDKLDRLSTTSGNAVTVVNDDLTETTSVTPVQTIKYDRRGNVIETIVEMGATDARTLAWYDDLDRKIAEADPMGSLTRWTYDAAGNVLSMKRFGTAITLPSDATGTAPTGGSDYRETTYAYDRSNRLTTTTIAALLTGEWTGSVYTLIAATAGSTSNIVTTLEYDKAGNVVHQEDGRGNDVWTWYDKLDRAVAQVDAENYLTVWTRDAEGNALTEVRYTTQITGSYTTASSVATLQGLTGTTTADRTTTFTYDVNGRRLTETRSGVASVSTDSAGVATTGGTTSTITYTYNALGQVLTKVEANSDTTTYVYDAIGRLTLETGQSFTDYNGSTATPRTAYAYDGLNNLKSTRVQIDSSGTNSLDRVTTYTYGAGGRLATMTDANGFVRTYGYDLAGRTVRESWTRVKADGSTNVTEAAVTRYDLAGRAITQTNARYASSTWVFTSELSGNPAYDAVRIQYNAYGEMTGRGLTAGPAATAVYQETFDYDTAGRLWKSNSGDGSLRFYVYDKAGNQTLTLSSTGADLSSLTLANYTASITSGSTGDVSTTDAVTTLTAYDKRGQATSTREPDRLLAIGGGTTTITRAKTYNAFGEVTAETDARGYTTSFTYNTMGRMLSKVSPQVSITAENGTVTTTATPTETYGYDISGRLVKVTDANTNVTTRLLLAGTGHGDAEAMVTKEFHPGGLGVFETKYDVFGDVRTLRNELYTGANATATDETRAYDKLGRLVTQVHRGAALTDSYGYDVLGQRITHYNSQLTSSVKETTDYDVKGRVTATVLFGGDSMAYSYVWTTSLSTSGLGDFDGWVKTSLNTSSGIQTGLDTTESTDYFGRVIGRTDFAEVATTMAFDKGGRLLTQVIGGTTTTTAWYNTGLAASVTTGGAVSTYTYDIAGARLTEKYVVSGVTYQDATATWDAMGRMTNFHDNGVSGGAAVNIDYEYDAVGNIRHLKSVYNALDDQGNVVTSGGPQGQDYWYAYDAMNRFVITQGQLVKWGSNNHVAIDGSGARLVGEAARGLSGTVMDRYLTGTEITWDNAGNRITASRTLAEESYEAESGTHYVAFTEQKETYSYSADGYLARTDIVQGASTAYFNYMPGEPYRRPPAASGSGVGRAIYGRDAMGRVTSYAEYNPTGYVSGSPATNLSYSRTAAYDAGGRVTQDDTTSVRSDGTFRAVSDYAYNATLSSGLWSGVATGGTYLGGAVTLVTTKNYKNTGGSADSDAPDTLTVNGFVWGQGAVLTHVDYDKDTGSSSNTVWTSAYTHDGSGFLTGATITDERPRTVALVNDAEGRVLQRDEADSITSGTGSGDPRQLHYYFNGIRVGDISNNGTSNTDYASSINAHITLPAYGPFQGGAASGSAVADFDQSYDAINGLTYDSTASSYTVQGGDTLAGIAHQIWGDASLWYLIAEANGLGGAEALVAGRVLTIPNKVHNSHNNTDTWRPYDPNEAQGDLSPTDAKKPKGNKCGVFGQILTLVVTVVVTKFLGPAIGDLARQGMNNLMGVQKGIHWNEVAIAQIGYLLSPSRDSSGLIPDFIAGGASNAATQGIAQLLHLQKDFDWTQVAVAGTVHAASNLVTNAFGSSPGAQIAANVFSGLAGAAARSLLTSTSFGDNIIAVLPQVVANTAGGWISGGIENAFGGAPSLTALDAATAKIQGLSQKIGDSVTNVGMLLGNAPGDISNAGAVLPQSFSPPSLGSASASSTTAKRRGVVTLLDDRMTGNDPTGTFGAAAATVRHAPTRTDLAAEAARGSLGMKIGGWHMVVVPKSGTYSATGSGTVHVDGEDLASDHNSATRHTLVQISINGGGTIWEKDTIENKRHYRVLANNSGEVIGNFEPIIGYSGWSYLTSSVPIKLAGVVEYSIIPVDSDHKDQLGWRGWQFEKDSGRAAVGAALWRQELASPGSVEYMFREGEIQQFAEQEHIENQLKAFDWEMGAVAAPFIGIASFFGPGEIAGPAAIVRGAFGRFGSRSAAKSGDALLLSRGVADAGLRQSILDTGFNPAILGDASSTTLARFDKLFQGSLDAGKSFRGRLGNLSTRARTIETAVDIDRAGLRVEFESMVDLGGGRARFVDVAGRDANGSAKYFQLYREAPRGGIPLREINAANDIFSKTGIRPVMIRTGP